MSEGLPSHPPDAAASAAEDAGSLLSQVYEELRKLAASRLRDESEGHTLQPTALVHEAWLRLIATEDRRFANRAHFFASAAEAMRRILIDHARRKSAQRHGGGLQRVDLSAIDLPAKADEATALAISECLDALEREDSKAAELVKLRFFGGLTLEECAAILGVTDRTARRY